MIRKVVAIAGLLFLFGLSSGVTAKEIAGIQIPESLEQAGISLMLNGAGVKSRFFIDRYVCALYLQDRSQDWEKILRGDTPVGFRLQVVTDWWLDADDLKGAMIKGFEKATGRNIEPILLKIVQFMAILDVEIEEGDFFDFIYLPSQGTKMYKNGRHLDDIKGLSFRRAFFGIWLGSDPLDEDLKVELLGL